MQNTSISSTLEQLGIKPSNSGSSTGSISFKYDQTISSYSPVNGEKIAEVGITSKEDFNRIVETASEAFLQWRAIPAPQRGEIVRQFGDRLRALKEPLGMLVSYEMGKSLQKGFEKFRR